MGLLDGLESMGFQGLQSEDIFKKEAKPQSKQAANGELETPMDFLFTKSFTCPVCEFNFSAYVVRKSKLRLDNVETDMKPNYKIIDPGYYDVLLCDSCGYAAMMSAFNRVSDKQAERILKEIKPRFVPKEFPVPFTPAQAVERYKMALLTAVIKGVKSGEKAILCLKLAWLHRDLGDKANEQIFLQNALTGLKDAYENESFPIGGMDGSTVEYMIAELSRRTGNITDAMKWISSLMVRRDISKTLRDRADLVRDLIREESSKRG